MFSELHCLICSAWRQQYSPEIQQYILLLLAIPRRDFFQAGDIRLNTPAVYNQLTETDLLRFPDDGELNEGRSLMAYILTQEGSTSYFKGKNGMTRLAFWLLDIYINRRAVER